MTAAIDDVIAERRRQIEAEGWTPEHDDTHDEGELLRAAVIYYQHAKYGTSPNDGAHGVIIDEDGAPLGWPWDAQWWKPKNARRDLVRAGALCLAEEARKNRQLNRPSETAYPPARHKLRLIIAEIDRIDAALAQPEEQR